jgi:hypothetical protein
MEGLGGHGHVEEGGEGIMAGLGTWTNEIHRIQSKELLMITNFKGKTAVLTGAGSGFGLECARIAAKLGMNLVLVDVQQDALDQASAEMQCAGAQVLSFRIDVSSAKQMQVMSEAVFERFGAPHFVFNNAGVGSAAEVAQQVFDAVAADQFYIFSHPKALGNVQSRIECVLQQTNPVDPFAERPDIGSDLKAALRSA